MEDKTQEKTMIKFRETQFIASKHAMERFQERFGSDVCLQDMIGRGKILNDKNVSQWPWQRKSLMNMISNTQKFIVNPYYNLKAVVDYATKTLITVEYLDASHTEYGRLNYNYCK